MTIHLYAEQKRKLDFLRARLSGGPPLAGMVREAVAEYLDRRFDQSLDEAYSDEHNDAIQLLK